MPHARRLLAALAAILIAGTPAAASAATGAGTTTRILTSPPRVLASVTPGSSTTTTVLVVNQSRSSVSLLVRAADLAPDPEGATFGVLADVGDAPRGAGRWLTIDRPTLALGPGEEATVRATIRVPQDADAGGHYGAIVVETAPDAGGPAAQDPVELRVRLVTHFNVLVPGNVRYDASITDVQASRISGGRIEVSGTFENDGNIQTTPRDVQLRVAGPTGTRTVEFRIPETMPGGTRTIERRVEIPSPAGRFTSRVSMKLEDGSEVRSRPVSVVAWRPWVPWALVAAVGALSLLLIGFPWYRRHRELQRYIKLELEELEAQRADDGSDTIEDDA